MIPLEVLFLLEEHAEGDNGTVDEQAAGYRHDHSLNLNQARMRQHDGKSCTSLTLAPCPTSFKNIFKDRKKLTHSHHYQKAGTKLPQIENRRTRALVVIRIRTVTTDPVRYWREDVGGDDEEGVVDLPEGAGEDDEEEAYGEDEGEGDDCFETGGHFGEEGLGVFRSFRG